MIWLNRVGRSGDLTAYYVVFSNFSFSFISSAPGDQVSPISQPLGIQQCNQVALCFPQCELRIPLRIKVFTYISSISFLVLKMLSCGLLPQSPCVCLFVQFLLACADHSGLLQPSSSRGFWSNTWLVLSSSWASLPPLLPPPYCSWIHAQDDSQGLCFLSPSYLT